jgi:hypothetical protein
MRTIIRAVVMMSLLAASFSWADEQIRPYQDGIEAYEAEDYKAAYGIILPYAEGGFNKAQHLLGYMYSNGLGLPKDNSQAIHWYRAAAESGHFGAQHNLGSMYYRGQGVSQNLVLAHMWINIAASNLHDAPLGSDGRGYSDQMDKLESIMTPKAITEAQGRARTCMESNYQDCD